LFDCSGFTLDDVIKVLLVELMRIVDFVKLMAVFILGNFNEQVVDCHQYLTMFTGGGHSL